MLKFLFYIIVILIARIYRYQSIEKNNNLYNLKQSKKLLTYNSEVLGNIVVDENNKPLYIFTNDKPNIPNCVLNYKCSELLIPYYVDNKNIITSDYSVTGKIRYLEILKDNKFYKYHVTLNEWPLYYFVYNLKEPKSELIDISAQGVKIEDYFILSINGRGSVVSTIGKKPPTDANKIKLLLDSNEIKFASNYICDKDGRSLYLYNKDKYFISECFNDNNCTSYWPPYFINNEEGEDYFNHDGSFNKNIEKGLKVDSSLKETMISLMRVMNITTNEYKYIFTYNGFPLYYFINDKIFSNHTVNNGNGQALQHNNGRFYLISPDGNVNVQTYINSTTENLIEPYRENSIKFILESNIKYLYTQAIIVLIVILELF